MDAGRTPPALPLGGAHSRTAAAVAPHLLVRPQGSPVRELPRLGSRLLLRPGAAGAALVAALAQRRRQRRNAVPLVCGISGELLRAVAHKRSYLRRSSPLAIASASYMFEDDLGGGSILAQLAQLDEDEKHASDSDNEDDDPTDVGGLSSKLQSSAQEMQARHERGVVSGEANGHAPVLLHTSMEFLFPPMCAREDDLFDGNYADCSFGRGGHSREILNRLSPSGRLFCFDVDPTAVRVAQALCEKDPRMTFFHRPCGEIADAIPEGISLHGVVIDVGISTPQQSTQSRGFSLSNLDGSMDRPLDLRYNQTAGIPASEWLKGTTTEELAWVLRKYGSDNEESLMAERVAEAIIGEQRLNGPYENMKRFAEVIGRARASYSLGSLADKEEYEHPTRGLEHPARLTVQALRIFLNCELDQLRKSLDGAFARLVHGGRCVTASFKRKEAYVIRKFLLDHEEPDASVIARVKPPRRLRELYPLLGTDLDFTARLMGPPMKPSQMEVARNRQARSAELYAVEKCLRVSKKVKTKARLEKSRFTEPKDPVFVGATLADVA